MAAPYVKRYPGGFLDLPNQTTPVDSAFLNAVETALLHLLGEAPANDEVGVWTGGAGGGLVYQKITNAQIAAGAAIDKSKLAALNITDADIAAAAGIAKSKLGPLNIADADIQAAAAIAISKLAGYPNDAGKVLTGDGSWDDQTMVKLYDNTLGAATAGWDVAAGLTGYTHLKCILTIRGDAAVTAQQFMIRLNGDSTASYDWQRMYSNTTSMNAAEGIGDTKFLGGWYPANSAAASKVGEAEILLPNYADTTFQQTFTSKGSATHNVTTGTFYTFQYGGQWRVTAAITRVQILPESGNFVAGSRLTIYGIK